MYPSKLYRIRWHVNKAGSKSYANLAVPSHIADAVFAKSIEYFVVELTDEGILYRPVTAVAAGMVKPEWLE